MTSQILTTNTPETNSTRLLVARFVQNVWNAGDMAAADSLLGADYIDHSLPPPLVGINGIKQWIAMTSAAFNHQTIIEDQVTEGDRSTIRLIFRVTHIGPWRTIAPTGATVETRGYRSYRVADGRIVEHWALIDGDSLEHQLRNYIAHNGTQP